MKNKLTWNNINKNGRRNAPKLSCRVLVCFSEFGFNERHMCAGWYHTINGTFTMDDPKYDEYTVAYWIDVDDIPVPKNKNKL